MNAPVFPRAARWLSLVGLLIFLGAQSIVWGQAKKRRPRKKLVEKTCFREVARRLDAYGNLYVYLSTERMLRSLDDWITRLKPFVEQGIAAAGARAGDPAGPEMGMAILKMLGQAYRESGVREISGGGASSLALGKNFYRNRLFIHHWPDNDKGKLWKVFGAKMHRLETIDFLPVTTALAVCQDYDLNLLWDWHKQLVAASENADLIQKHHEFLTNLNRAVGLEKLIKSTDGEMGLILTLDEKKMINIPVGQVWVQVPEPGFVLFLKVKDDTLLKFIDRNLAARQIPIQMKTVFEVPMRSLPLPLPLPFELTPTLAMSDGYLLIATNPGLMTEVLAVKKGKKEGLAATAKFKDMARKISFKGNQFHYVSPLLGKTIADLQQRAIQAAGPDAAGAANLFPLQGGGGSFFLGVLQVMPDGLLYTANSNVPVTNVLVLQAAVAAPAAVAIMAGMLLPVLSKAREKARRVNSAGNLKSMGLACLMFSGETGGRFPEPDGDEGLNKLVEENILNLGKVYINPNDEKRKADPLAEKLTDANNSYVYIGAGFSDDDAEATSTPIAFEKPIPNRNWINVLFIDGHVEGFAGKFRTCEDVIKHLHNRRNFRTNERYELLLNKARALDKKGYR